MKITTMTPTAAAASGWASSAAALPPFAMGAQHTSAASTAVDPQSVAGIARIRVAALNGKQAAPPRGVVH